MLLLETSGPNWSKIQVMVKKASFGRQSYNEVSGQPKNVLKWQRNTLEHVVKSEEQNLKMEIQFLNVKVKQVIQIEQLHARKQE